MAENQKETLEICRLSIGDQVQFAMAGIRAGHFNRHPAAEGFRSVVKARWAIIESLIYAEQNRIELRHRQEDPETVLADALLAARDMIAEAKTQFEFYVLAHRQKGTPEAAEKAEVNLTFATRCGEAWCKTERALKAVGRG